MEKTGHLGQYKRVKASFACSKYSGPAKSMHVPSVVKVICVIVKGHVFGSGMVIPMMGIP